MAKNTPFSDIHRPYDGILIQVRKDLAFPDSDFTNILRKLSSKTYQVGTKGCKYNAMQFPIQ
jgi:hypothetical protein